jgi:predicted O-methyltransferase YrrM
MGREELALKAVEVRRDVTLEAARFDEDAVAPGHASRMKEMWQAPLEKYLAGVEAGAANGVLENLFSFSPPDGRILYDLIVEKGCRRGLEIGTSIGTPGVWMGMAFKKNGGKLVTIDRNATSTQKAEQNLRNAGLAGVVECRVNNAFVETPKLEGEFDFVFMDTGTALHKKFLDAVWAKGKPGGAIVSHNANSLERQQPGFYQAISTGARLETKMTRTSSAVCR